MKEKLSPFIERINPKLFLIKSDYLTVDQKPLLEYLRHFKKPINTLIDESTKVLIIENVFIREVSVEGLKIEHIFLKSQFIPFQPITEDIYEYIIILGESNTGFISPQDVFDLVKNQTGFIFISYQNEELLRFFKNRV